MLTAPAVPLRIGIVGAGMAGLACAAQLVANGHRVQLFDKGRGPGGRMSTRRMATPLGDAHFDHGAQYFTARDAGFQALVADWERRNLASRWDSSIPDAWVGNPGMNAVIKAMVAPLDVTFGLPIKGLVRDAAGWSLMTADSSLGPFDAVLLAIPAEQAAPLLALHDLALAHQAMLARSQPCWTAMFAFAEPVVISRDVIRGPGDICWAARNSAKPGRAGPEAWVVQASGGWSAAHIEDEADLVAAQLLHMFAQEAATPLPDLVASSAHRWRFALSAGTGLGALWNGEIGLGACGDWLLGPRVECAWLSGRTLASVVARPTAAPLHAAVDHASLRLGGRLAMNASTAS